MGGMSVWYKSTKKTSKMGGTMTVQEELGWTNNNNQERGPNWMILDHTGLDKDREECQGYSQGVPARV